MEKEKNIMELTKTVAGSLPVLKNGDKSSIVMDELNKIGLISGSASTPLMWSLKSLLNSLSFLYGLIGLHESSITDGFVPIGPIKSFFGVNYEI